MALEKQTRIDRVEVLEDGRIQVREVRTVMENGVEIASGFHRSILDPAKETEATVATKVGTTDGMVNRVAKAAWTKEVVDARKAAYAAPSRMGVSVKR